VAERRDAERLLSMLDRAIQNLSEGFQGSGDVAPLGPREALNLLSALEGARSLLRQVTSNGECRRKTPFSPLHPVIDSEGHFMWCCNHDPEHCAQR
jgi:hypothetical protein